MELVVCTLSVKWMCNIKCTECINVCCVCTDGLDLALMPSTSITIWFGGVIQVLASEVC